MVIIKWLPLCCRYFQILFPNRKLWFILIIRRWYSFFVDCDGYFRYSITIEQFVYYANHSTFARHSNSFQLCQCTICNAMAIDLKCLIYKSQYQWRLWSKYPSSTDDYFACMKPLARDVSWICPADKFTILCFIARNFVIVLFICFVSSNKNVFSSADQWCRIVD